MNPTVSIPVKVLVGQDMHPGEKELKEFYEAWITSGKKQPFTGEYNIPSTNDTGRLMTTDPRNVSHCITDIHMNTYDKAKATVMVDVKFTGPKGDDASDEYIANKVRFVARAVKVTDENGKQVDKILTWDLMHAHKGYKPKKH